MQAWSVPFDIWLFKKYFARLKDISTPNFSTPSFKPRPFNPGLFNHELYNPGLFNPRLFNHELSNPGFFNPRFGVEKSGVEKSGVEKFMVEKSGVERSRVETWGWKARGWDVLQPLFSPPFCWCGFKRCSKRELPHWTQRILFCNKDFLKKLFNLFILYWWVILLHAGK